VLELYGDADVFVLASAHESFGMAAAEAAAAGRATVVTDRCGIAEMLRDGAGLVVPYDQVALGSAIARLIGDAGLRRRLGDGARAVAAQWSWPRVVELQETIYRQALERA
jgi:glycosyltransferase involved in cell wall biosynthesis